MSGRKKLIMIQFNKYESSWIIRLNRDYSKVNSDGVYGGFEIFTSNPGRKKMLDFKFVRNKTSFLESPYKLNPEDFINICSYSGLTRVWFSEKWEARKFLSMVKGNGNLYNTEQIKSMFKEKKIFNYDGPRTTNILLKFIRRS